MKRLLFLLLIALSCADMQAQSCANLSNHYIPEQFIIDGFNSTAVCDLIISEYGFYGYENITNLNGLSELTFVGGNLEIDGNVSLYTLNGLENLDTIMGNLEITGNYSLQSLSGLNNLKYVGGNVVIGRTGVTNFEGLNSLNYIGGDFKVGDFLPNRNLTNFAGLENLTYIGGTLDVDDSPDLNNLEGLESLISIGGSVNLNDNDDLINLNGLENLTSIGGELKLSNNNILTDISALESLSFIGEKLFFYGNHSLTNLNGLENLNSVTEISVFQHNNLNDVSGLENVDDTGILFLSLSSNPNLSVCNEVSICNYLQSGGTATIGNNAPGCNSPAEVEDSCIFLPVEISTPLQARLQNQTALLTWRTETETHNAGFEIQRSQDGIQWERIGWQTGQGTTTTPHAYVYTDESPLSGTSYYRLKQVDFDGNFAYSNIADLYYGRNTPINVYPNPVRDILYINTERPVQQALIFDTTGKQINIQMTNNKIDVSTLNGGIYTLKITIGDSVFYEKVLIK